MKKYLIVQCIALLVFTVQVMASDHFVSFIIPCYNCQEWIEEAVASIYQQGDLKHPFEVILTDDGSSDDTYTVLCEIKENYDEVKVFRHLRNQGGGLTRNTCVYHSKGDLIFCLDSDNVLYSDSVQSLIDRLDETGADVVSFGGLKYFTGNFEVLGSFQYETPGTFYDLQALLNHQNTPPWSGNYLYTRASFDRAGGYPPRLTTDTFSFGIRQVVTGSKFTYLPGTYYWHRIGIESYYTRESRTNRIGIDFFDTILALATLLERDSLSLIEQQRERAINGWPYVDQIEILEKKLLKVK